MRTLPARSPFTTASAHAVGWTDSALHHAVDRGNLIRLRRGVYAEPCTVADPLRLAVAAGLAYPGVPLSHLSGALVFGVPIVGATIRQPEMTVAPRGPGHVRGVDAYRARLRDHDLRVVDGTLVTSPARTVLDIARHYAPVTAIVALDYVLHEKLATADELRDVLEFCRTWPGAEKARRAARRCDSRSESPLESVSRLVIPRLNLGVPEPQVLIFDEHGRFVGRGDFYFDQSGVVGEADGEAKYDDGRDVLVKEKRREIRLEDTELEVARWSWTEAWSQQAVLGRRLRRAQNRGAARDCNGVARRWTFETTERIAVL